MPKFTFGPFSLDSDARVLLRGGEPVLLTGKTFDMLLLLVQNRGRLVDKDELLSAVWRGAIVEEANLTQSIYTVRKVLGDSPREHRFIATVPGRGYQFVASVSESVTQIVPETSSPLQGIAPRPKRRFWPWLVAASVCLTAALVVVSAFREPQRLSLGTAVQLTNDGLTKNELITDGTRVFYSSPRERNLSNWRMFQVSVKGGETRPFSLAANELSPFDINANGTELLMGPSRLRQSNNGWMTPDHLWTESLSGGPASMLSVRAHDACWSPDGSEIAYAVEHEIGLARKDGVRVRKLADVPGVAAGLRWSPDGQRIRFTLHGGVALKDAAIWEISLGGGKALPLFPAAKNQQGDGEWTPDGRYYLFSQINDGVSQIWAIAERRNWLRSSAQVPIRLTTGPLQSFLPTPSPDGKRVFFYGAIQRSQLFKFDAKSSHFERFLPRLSAGHTSFSRDGKWMAYSSYPEHALWRAAADGSERLRLSPPEMIAMLPVVSPDGSRVAFVGGLPGHTPSIFVVSRDGGALETVTSSEPKGIIEPDWSPDGNSLVLGGGGGVLYRYQFADKTVRAVPGSEGLWSPRWSPDGRFIAALGGPTSKLILYESESHRQTELTQFGVAYPSWARDGHSIYFRSAEKGEAWCRLRLRDHQIERIVSLEEAGALPARPCRGIPRWIDSWAGLAPDGSLLTPSEAGSTEIYSAELIDH